MNIEQPGGQSPLSGGGAAPRRSTRVPKPSDSSGPSNGRASNVSPDSGAKSRLENGARNQPGVSPNEGGKRPEANPKPEDKKAAKDGTSGRSSQEKNGKSGRPNEGTKSPNANQDNKKAAKDGSNAPSSQEKGEGGRSNDGANQSPGDSPGKSNGSLKDKAKGATSNATGIDYSDKSAKDQLEHQAADVAMDATPGLSQFNSARRALKDFNKAKKSAGGGEDGVTDKAEELMDEGVDKGIKGVKLAAGATMVGSAGQFGLAALMLMKMLMMLKGMAMAVVGKVVGFFGSIFSGMSSFFSGVLGVTAAIGKTIAVGVSVIVVAGSSIFGVGVVQELTRKDDSFNCVPIQTKVSQRSQSYIGSGEMEAVREDHAVKLWSVYSALGSSKEQTAAVLGNLQAESSLDPTAVETIYSEPFSIGTNKQSAIAVDFKVELIDSAYAARFPAIDYVGIGLAQWTNGRNRLLINYANNNGVNWFDFDTQVRFMLDGDEPTRQDQLTNFLNAEPGNVQSETERFMNAWIGLSSPNSSLSNRQTNATDYLFILERATTDTNYADSILSGINVNRSQGNRAAGAYHQDDGCGNPIKTHYGNQSADGTGEVPSDLVLVPWSRETFPSSLGSFAKNPEDAGLAWGNASGWANGIIPDQCAAFSHSYFMQIYPGWNQYGRPTTRAYGDGKDTAANWAAHYGERVTDYPSAGAVFSDPTTSEYGHTGIVQHVFANGDILIAEQNIRGVSGEGAGLNYSWSWRVIRKDRYEQSNWEFFKPSDAAPRWMALNV